MFGPMAISKFNLNVKSRDTSRTTQIPTSSSPSIGVDWENQNMGLRQFGEEINDAVNAVFPTENNGPRYLKATVLILVWVDDRRESPALDDLDRLSRVFNDVYNFEVEKFEIPRRNPHFRVNQKIKSFARQGEDNREYLKIVYYAGSSRVTSNGSLLWESSSYAQEKETPSETPSLLWSDIQPFLERAQNDVLMLLDCYTFGGIVGQGNGVTELVSAGDYDSMSNTAPVYSFTSALATGLETMVRSRRNTSFSVGELYSNIYKTVRHNMTGDINDRQSYPTHHVLTQEHPRRSIHISTLPPYSLHSAHGTSGNINHLSYTNSRETMLTSRISVTPRDPFQYEGSLSRVSTADSVEVPRLAFAIRLENNLQNSRISQALFDDWFKHVPPMEKLKVEAAFNSVSSLLIISVPISIAAYIPTSPGIIPLGPIRSSNLLVTPLTVEPPTKYRHLEKPLPAIITSPDGQAYDNTLFQPPPTPQDDYESMCSSSFNSIHSDLFNPYSGFEADGLDLDDDQTPTSNMTSQPQNKLSPNNPLSPSENKNDDIKSEEEEDTLGVGLQFQLIVEDTSLPPLPKVEPKQRSSRTSLKPPKLKRSKTLEDPDDFYDALELTSWLTSHLTRPPPEDIETDALPDLETLALAWAPLPSIQKFTVDEYHLQTPTLASFPRPLPSPKKDFDTQAFYPERVQFPLHSSEPLPIPPAPSDIFKALVKTPQGRRTGVQAFFDPTMRHCWTSPEFVEEYGFKTKNIYTPTRNYGDVDEDEERGLGYDIHTGILMPECTVDIPCKILVNGREAWGNVVFNVSPIVEGSCLVFGRGMEDAGVEAWRMPGW